MSELVLVESGLLDVYQSSDDERVVSGLELHKFLEIGTNYSTWFKRMCEYGFKENVDYVEFWSDSKNGNAVEMVGNPQQMTARGYSLNHALKINTAKEIAMIQRSEKGKKARLYFIEVEEKYRKMISQPPTTLQSLQVMIDNMVAQEKRTLMLEQTQQEQQSKLNKLETSFNEESNVEGYVTNGNIARKLHLYSTTGRPHEKFVDGVARELNIYNNKIGYADEYIKVVRETNGGVVTGVAYYTPLGVELIEKYVKDNFNPTEQMYVRGAKKGQFNKSFFTIRESNYFFNEETQKRYKQ